MNFQTKPKVGDALGEGYQEMVRQISRHVAAEQERLIRRALLDHLGYLPTFSDVAKWGHIVIHRDGTYVLTWRGENLIQWTA